MSKAAELAALIGSQTAQSNRNLFVNGGMQVHQRGNQTSSSGSSVYFVDRFNLYHVSGAAANLQQSTVVPSGQGFSNSLLIDCTTADTSVAATDVAVLRQVLEGKNLQQLAFGVSGAKSLTLSFWVRSTKTGTYVCEIYHNDSTTRHISKSYTISSADTWEYKTLTFPGDTAATIDNDNQATFYVQWALMAGADTSDGTLATSWQNLDDNDRFVGQVNFFDSTSNNFYLTGAQLEVGEQATAFEHRSFGDDYAACQRYYFKMGQGVGGLPTPSGGYFRYAIGACQGSTSAGCMFFPPVPMRATPTLEQTGTAGDYALYEADAVHALTGVPAINSAQSSHTQFNVTASSSGNLASGNAVEFMNNNSGTAYLAFSAEL